MVKVFRTCCLHFKSCTIVREILFKPLYQLMHFKHFRSNACEIGYLLIVIKVPSQIEPSTACRSIGNRDVSLWIYKLKKSCLAACLMVQY